MSFYLISLFRALKKIHRKSGERCKARPCGEMLCGRPLRPPQCV